MSIPDPNIYLQTISSITTDLTPVRKRKARLLAWLKTLMSPSQWLNDLLFKDYAAGQIYPAFNGFAVYTPGVRITFTDGANYEFIYANPLSFSGHSPASYPQYWTKLQSSFIGARERARYNGQKLLLEYMLNRTYQIAPFSAQEWEVIWVANVPVVQSAPPYTQIYIKQTSNVQSNFWLSLGNGLVTYLAHNASSSMSFLGNAYPTYSPNQFTIYVPTAVYGAIAAIQPPGVTSPGDPAPNAAGAAIRAVVNQYAIAGSQYNIIKY